VTEPLAVYLVRGDDAALRSEAVRALVHELVGTGDLSLMVEEFEAVDDGDTAAIADAAQTPPFLTDRRIVVARDIGSYASEALEPLLRYLEDPLPTSSIVLVSGDKALRSQKLLNAVKKVGHVVESAVPTNRGGRKSWLQEQLRDAPVRLDTEALSLVEKHLGEDLGRLRNLLEGRGAG
jgi:DNA polymerase-3 subunit delta